MFSKDLFCGHLKNHGLFGTGKIFLSIDNQQAHGVKLLMYEGGPGMVTSNAVDNNATVHAISFDRSDEMEIAVTDVLESWYNITNTDSYNSHPGKDLHL